MFKNTNRRLHTALIGLILIVSLVSVASFPATVQAKGGGGLIGAIVGAVVGVAVVVATGGVGAAILYGTAAGVVSALDYRSCSVNIVWSSNCPGGGGGTAVPAPGGTCVGPANACGQAYQGTEKTVRVARTVKRVCSAPKTAPPLPAGYGTSCTSSANSCGQTTTGTIQCNGSCSATAPSDSSCPVWTNYCTGATDPNGNNWQIWAYSNQTPTGYKYVGPGTAANNCLAPAAPATATTTNPTSGGPGASCSAVGTNSWGAGCTAQLSSPSVPDGQTITVANTAVGYTGSVQWTCANGTWTGPYNATCVQIGPTQVTPPNQNPANTAPAPGSSTSPVGSTPAGPVCVPNQGASCTSTANFCEKSNPGTILCGGCSASTPSDSLCPPPTVWIKSDTLRVQMNKQALISWDSTYAKTCTVKENGAVVDARLHNLSGTPYTITTQTIFSISCSGPGGGGSTATGQLTVNVVPIYQEF